VAVATVAVGAYYVGTAAHQAHQAHQMQLLLENYLINK
jgi:hypothetical protein